MGDICYEHGFGRSCRAQSARCLTLLTKFPSFRNDQMICSALEFISSIAAKVQYAELFNDEVLEKITGFSFLIWSKLPGNSENICIRALRLREVDIDLWEDDAVEYLTQDLQGSNIGTRRRGAVDLVRSLYRRFSEKLTVLLTRVSSRLFRLFRSFGKRPCFAQ